MMESRAITAMRETNISLIDSYNTLHRAHQELTDRSKNMIEKDKLKAQVQYVLSNKIKEIQDGAQKNLGMIEGMELSFNVLTKILDADTLDESGSQDSE